MLKSVSGVFRCFVLVDISCNFGPVTSFDDGINVLRLAAFGCENKLKLLYSASNVFMNFVDDVVFEPVGSRAVIRIKFSFESASWFDICGIARLCDGGAWFESFFGNRSIYLEDFESVLL